MGASLHAKTYAKMIKSSGLICLFPTMQLIPTELPPAYSSSLLLDYLMQKLSSETTVRFDKES